MATIFKDKRFNEQKYNDFWARNDVNGDDKVSMPELFQEVYTELLEMDRIRVIEPGMNVDPLDREVFELMNKLRVGRQDFVKPLEEMKSRFEAPDFKQLKRSGRTTLATKEGVKGVEEAIEFCRRGGRLPRVNWNEDLYQAASYHVNDTGR